MFSKIYFFLRVIHRLSFPVHKIKRAKYFIYILALCIGFPVILFQVLIFFQKAIQENHFLKDFHLQGHYYINHSFEKDILDIKFKEIKKIKDIEFFFHFTEKVILSQADRGDFSPGVLRLLEPHFYDKAKDYLFKSFPLMAGSWDIQKKFQVVLSEKFLMQLLEGKENKVREFIKKIEKKSYPQIKIVYFNSLSENDLEKKDLEDWDFLEASYLEFLQLEVIGIFKPLNRLHDPIVFGNLKSKNSFKETESRFGSHSLRKNIAFIIRNPSKQNIVKKELKSLFKGDILFETWDSRFPNLKKFFEWEEAIFKILSSSILFLSSFLLMNIQIHLWLLNQKKEIALLKLLGFSFQKIYFIFIAQELWLVFLGLLLAHFFVFLIIFSFSQWVYFFEWLLELLFSYERYFYIQYSLEEIFLKINWDFFIWTYILIFLALILSITFSLRKLLKKLHNYTLKG